MAKYETTTGVFENRTELVARANELGLDGWWIASTVLSDKWVNARMASCYEVVFQREVNDAD